MSIRRRIGALEGILGDDEACTVCGHPHRTVRGELLDWSNIVRTCTACGRPIDHDGRPRAGAVYVIADEADPVAVPSDIAELLGVPACKIHHRGDIAGAV